MFVQISSGQGPSECQRVVWLVSQKFKKYFENLELIKSESGYVNNCYRSMTFEFPKPTNFEQLRGEWEGTISWRGKSPFRPNHKRQNWYVKVDFFEQIESEIFDITKVKIEAFRGSGPGGQHVNKTSTVIRAVYLPTGDTVVCMDERSQYANKQIALERLKEKITSRVLLVQKSIDLENRLMHYRLERGNSVKSFTGKL